MTNLEALGLSKPEELTNPYGEVLALRYDVSGILEDAVGLNWQEKMLGLMVRSGIEVVRDASHHTCREDDPTAAFSLFTIGGAELVQTFPGFWELYKGKFRDLMQSSLPVDADAMKTYDDPAQSMQVVQQLAPETASDVQNRMEAHVDQRYTAILVIEASTALDSGRLVVANNPEAKTVEEINQDALFIVHKPGTLICFTKGRLYPHYPEEIRDGEQRMIISINYPVEYESDEEARALYEHDTGQVSK